MNSLTNSIQISKNIIIGMGRREKREKREGRNEFREFSGMNDRLHEMLRSLGEEEVSNATIKLDEFQRLRLEFVKCSERYQKDNNSLKFESDQVERAKIVFELTSNKMAMETQLKQMTTLVLKLSEKVKREKLVRQDNNTKPKKKANKYKQVMNEEIEEPNEDDFSPLEKELEYKTLIVYTFEKNYFKLINFERREVAQVKRDLNNKKFASLQQFRINNPKVDRLLQEQQEQTLEQRQILDALKTIDNMIEQRMDNLLQGIKMLNHNAINISQNLDIIHKKILINLDKVQHNNGELKTNQKRMDEAAKYVTKPNCIMNVIIAVLLGLMGYLIVRLIWFP